MGTETDWKAEIKQVIDEPAGPGGRNLLLDTIEEFITTLNESRWLHATLEQGSMPSLRTIVLSPRTRRDERNVFLSLWVTPYSVSVVGDQDREIRSPSELQRFFVDLSKRSNLPATMEEYRKRCSRPVSAALRRGYSVPHTKGDLPVLVDPEEQEKLAEAADRGTQELVSVTVSAGMREHPNEDVAEYRLLDSAGLQLALTEGPRRLEANTLLLTGVPSQPRGETPPLRLVSNAGKCSLGSTVVGMGFLLTAEERAYLLDKDPRNGEVIAP